MEPIIDEIIQEYAGKVWLSFVSLVITGFIMIFVRNFIRDLSMYMRARMSDIGFGQRIFWRGKEYVVSQITFRYIIVLSKDRKLRIPISTYLTGGVEFPRINFDDSEA